jgi:hypothetical protein
MNSTPTTAVASATFSIQIAWSAMVLPTLPSGRALLPERRFRAAPSFETLAPETHDYGTLSGENRRALFATPKVHGRDQVFETAAGAVDLRCRVVAGNGWSPSAPGRMTASSSAQEVRLAVSGAPPGLFLREFRRCSRQHRGDGAIRRTQKAACSAPTAHPTPWT